MKDIRQIRVINKALEGRKKLIMTDIMNLNKAIKYKLDLIVKIERYQQDYQSIDGGGLAQSVPSLLSNRYMFSGRIFELIERERKEIEIIKAKLQLKFQELSKLENKISSMEYFEQDILSKRLLKMNAQDQRDLDEIVNLNLIGNEND